MTIPPWARGEGHTRKTLSNLNCENDIGHSRYNCNDQIFKRNLPTHMNAEKLKNVIGHSLNPWIQTFNQGTNSIIIFNTSAICSSGLHSMTVPHNLSSNHKYKLTLHLTMHCIEDQNWNYHGVLQIFYFFPFSSAWPCSGSDQFPQCLHTHLTQH